MFRRLSHTVSIPAAVRLRNIFPTVFEYLRLSIIFAAATSTFGQIKLEPVKIKLSSGLSFSINVPPGFEILPAAEGLKRVRFMAKSPDGRIFVTDMFNLTDNRRGTIYILDDFDPGLGKFKKIVPYLTGLRNPNSVQFYRDSAGGDWIYIAETQHLTRRRFQSGETKPSDSEPQVIATFPDYGLSYKYGGWHLTRTIAFGPNGKLYVSVGSSCNSCIEKEEVRAGILEMNPDGSGQRIFARGLRNAVGLRFIDNQLYVTNQGSDHLGKNSPDETFYLLRDGADYGWPFCHSASGRIIADPKLRRPRQCVGVVRPDAFFPAHSSALGFDFFGTDSPEPLGDFFLVSLHGSTDKSIGHGYKIVRFRPGKRPEDFITGFLVRSKVFGRPCDIMKLTADSFLFTDDYSGIIYLVRKRKAYGEVNL